MTTMRKLIGFSSYTTNNYSFHFKIIVLFNICLTTGLIQNIILNIQNYKLHNSIFFSDKVNHNKNI
jgi:hypothetical protein